MAVAERPTRTFRDLRDWLKRIDDLGELRVVRGARAEDEIGMATELAGRVHGTPALLFDETPGSRSPLGSTPRRHPRTSYGPGRLASPPGSSRSRRSR